MKFSLSVFVVGSLALAPAGSTSARAAAQGAQERFEVHPSTQDPAVKVTLETLERWETELSNWGRWGPKDQRGTLNLITPEKTRAATRLVEDGVTVTLGHFVTEEEAIDSQTFGPTEHWMTSIDPDTGRPRGALDAMSFSLHDGQLAHMDALCHYATRRDGKAIIFNGYPQNLNVGGCTGDLAIDDMGPGYVTRGILVDMPLLRGVDWLDPSTPIYVSDLEEWEDFAGVTISSGDVLFIRGGRWASARGDRSVELRPRRSGAARLGAAYLAEGAGQGVALLVGDAVNDVQPSGVEAGINRPIHTMTQVFIRSVA